MALLSGLRRSVLGMFDSKNKWNEAFLSSIGGVYSKYDTNGRTYVKEGFQKNPAVFSIIQQRYKKVRSIPYFVKRVDDMEAKEKIDAIMRATQGDMSAAQKSRYDRIQKKAYRKDTLGMPFPKPNPLQSWSQLWEMYEMFMCLDGNCYFYKLYGVSEPVAIYVLPAHLMTIVVKDRQSLSDKIQNQTPIDHYMLIEGPRFIEFETTEIIHIKNPNPDFGQDGAHLYGQSPLMAVLRNIQSFNEAVDNNNKTMRNSGAYGLIHGKGHRSLSKTQADQIKERLEEMDKDPTRLGQITGVSAEIGFTRIGMTTKELEPFAFLHFDEKQIANALGWDTRLLNQDAGATFDNLKIAEKRVVVATTKPSLDMLCEALNEEFFPLFKKYQGACIVFDLSELPEMQVNMKELVDWLSMAVDRAVINRDEFREAIGYDATMDENMEKFTVAQFLEPLDEAIDNAMALSNAPHDPNPLPE